MWWPRVPVTLTIMRTSRHGIPRKGQKAAVGIWQHITFLPSIAFYSFLHLLEPARKVIPSSGQKGVPQNAA